MSGEAFEQELQAWLAAREPAGAVTALLEAAEEDAAYLTSGVQIAAGSHATGGSEGVAAAVRQAAAPGSETVLFEQMWRSRHLIAAQALMTAGEAASGQEDRESRTGGLIEGGLGPEPTRGG